MILPFETDELALLEACAMAFAPLNTSPDRASARWNPPQIPLQRMVFKRLPGESAVIEPEAQDTEAEQRLFSMASPMTGEALSAEVFSRTIERDARRYGD